MKIHGIASSYFGDKEWDLGKSVRWLQYFCDTEFVLDANLNSRPRAYLIAWERTFKDAKYGYFSSHDFFKDLPSAAEWREDSFRQGDAAWDYDDDDWVLFVDCTEGICVDTNSPPPPLVDPAPSTDLDLDPFKGYVTQEIDNAGAVDVIYLPFWAFTRNSAPFTVYGSVDSNLSAITDAMEPEDEYQGLTREELLIANQTYRISLFSYFTNPGFLPRLVKVSALRDPGFDWESMDTFVSAAPPGAAESVISLSLISYAYAQWSADQTKYDLGTGLPESEEADDGFRMRAQISRVRPIPGLPFASWPPADTATEIAMELPEPLQPQPESVLTAGGPEFSDDFGPSTLNFQRREVVVPNDVWPLDRPLLTTPLYPTNIRENLREGLFFLDKELGPVPWNVLTGQARVDPVQWAKDAAVPVPQTQP